jgi:mono/diheme cytochrome c family protein
MSSEPHFRLNTEGRDTRAITPAQTEAITGTLGELFGTPDRPIVPEEVNLRLDVLQSAAGPIGCDAEGNQRGLFRRHCAACHGVSGDGAGPSAAVLNPYPRDFRDGVFKYTSTAGGAKPAPDDLLRTLRQGIPGTAMPSFRKLYEGEIQALLEYVEYLSIRGQTELYLLQAVIDEDSPLPLETREVIEDGALPAAKSWEDAKRLVVVPPEPPRQLAASVARGREIFHGAAAQCVMCHGATGDGNGDQSELYDDWNKRKHGDTPEQTRQLAERFRLPIELLRPRNFTLGKFHGGDRPIDQYWRIYAGIKGTPMPSAGPASGSTGVLRPEEIWHVVNYVRSLGRE